MQEEILKRIVYELDELLPGRFLGRLFQLSSTSLAIDFGLKDKGYLFIDIDPAAPRLYLIKRTVRELEKASAPLSSFAQAVRATLGGGSLLSLTRDENERVVRFSFANELGDSQRPVLVAQLTGRSANLFLLDSAGTIKHTWRNPHGEGQQVGELYRPPTLQAKSPSVNTEESEGILRISRENLITISAAADKYFRDLTTEHRFETLAGNLAAKLRKEITKQKKLQSNLRKDLTAHGNPDEHKRVGDLLLANVANAKRVGDRVSLTDYYADGTPTIEIEVDENATLQKQPAPTFRDTQKPSGPLKKLAPGSWSLSMRWKSLRKNV